MFSVQLCVDCYLNTPFLLFVKPEFVKFSCDNSYFITHVFKRNGPVVSTFLKATHQFINTSSSWCSSGQSGEASVQAGEEVQPGREKTAGAEGKGETK